MTGAVHIVADIGGTNARFARVEGDGVVPRDVRVFPCGEFAHLIDAVRSYMDESRLPAPDSVYLAVAGPVDSDWIDLPNNHWAFSQRELADGLGARLRVINDFSAQMLAIEALPESDLHWLRASRPRGGAARAVIGPGTGLGVSAMLPSGEILSSEGGHVAFAPANAHESALLEILRERYPRVSVERVLSGPGAGKPLLGQWPPRWRRAGAARAGDHGRRSFRGPPLPACHGGLFRHARLFRGRYRPDDLCS